MENIQKNVKNWIKENWLLSIICALVFWILSNLGTPEMKQSLARPISQLRFQDLAILVILHAWINRTETKKS